MYKHLIGYTLATLVAATLGVGGAIFAIPPKIVVNTVTKTDTVTKKITPQSCLDALTIADKAMVQSVVQLSYTNNALQALNAGDSMGVATAARGLVANGTMDLTGWAQAEVDCRSTSTQ